MPHSGPNYESQTHWHPASIAEQDDFYVMLESQSGWEDGRTEDVDALEAPGETTAKGTCKPDIRNTYLLSLANNISNNSYQSIFPAKKSRHLEDIGSTGFVHRFRRKGWNSETDFDSEICLKSSALSLPLCRSVSS